MSSPGSHRISSSDDSSSEDSTSSSSIGYYSSDSVPSQIPNPSIPEPQPVNQMLGQVAAEGEEPIDNEPGPYDPDTESWEEWEERLRTADMEFEEFAIPEDQPERDAGDFQLPAAKTSTVNRETVEIHDEDEHADDRSKEKGKEKVGHQQKKVATTHPSYAKKRARSDPEPASQSIEEAFVNLGLRLKEAGEIGPYAAERLGMGCNTLIRPGLFFGRYMGSPTELARLKKENEEMAHILKSQADELIRLSGLTGTMKAEISQLKEENGQLMDEVSATKKEMALKEQSFPGRAGAWVDENRTEAARVMTTSPEATMESFRLLYWEPEGKKMITAIGSFGFKSGQKKDWAASHRFMKKRDPDFSAAAYGLAPIPEEDPTPPLPPRFISRLCPVELVCKISNFIFPGMPPVTWAGSLLPLSDERPSSSLAPAGVTCEFVPCGGRDGPAVLSAPVKLTGAMVLTSCGWKGNDCDIGVWNGVTAIGACRGTVPAPGRAHGHDLAKALDGL
ncbi:unnamed protein product [Cuscuta campestris]|uniref:Uncharacterized protein n=1 Tax=Cuscuta campestris TaxID=132261 RepID=A0A484NBM8_9ASTE|nr:unnamed protein product [Cuscuta campestris]